VTALDADAFPIPAPGDVLSLAVAGASTVAEVIDPRSYWWDGVEVDWRVWSVESVRRFVGLRPGFHALATPLIAPVPVDLPEARVRVVDLEAAADALGWPQPPPPEDEEGPFDGLSVIGQRTEAGEDLAAAEQDDTCPSCGEPMTEPAGLRCQLAEEHETEILDPLAEGAKP
jgi:hypothetical protein